MSQNKKSSIFIALILSFPLLFLGFQNCGRFNMGGESTIGLFSVGDGFIFSLYREKMLGADLPTVLMVVPENLEEEVDSVDWSFTHSNEAVTCEQAEVEDQSIFWVEITCSAPGTLNVEVDIYYASGELENRSVDLILQEVPISRINPGEDLYQAFCADCHTPGLRWPIANSSVIGIKNAIQAYIAMDFLADELDDYDLSDISNYLNR